MMASCQSPYGSFLTLEFITSLLLQRWDSALFDRTAYGIFVYGGNKKYTPVGEDSLDVMQQNTGRLTVLSLSAGTPDLDHSPHSPWIYCRIVLHLSRTSHRL